MSIWIFRSKVLQSGGGLCILWPLLLGGVCSSRGLVASDASRLRRDRQRTMNARVIAHLYLTGTIITSAYSQFAMHSL